ncbi:mRNA-capping enzyme-like [Asparagus officinalis]|uniref:mRNA-capping enzyme-like n=1 Tax=Asparagus officinalis TaxID=4686 RepID=UPI00098E25D3|nr:mRNA-capping enzyme-like [Asparagus officinalis]XP_020252914.1 mRNA-capping enzyme-like [Asparagus officinalis]XP_020252915.1 mRNA-capping enzyme-like [Asparagus officinalis]XP_020252916.1 mRNA-capping enzyme-like [Asparagus officinalis]
MDLNASPLPEDDEQSYEQSYEEYVDDAQQPSESVQTMLREREERRRRLKRENRDEGPKQFSEPSRNDYMHQNRTSRGYGRVRQLPQGWLDCPSHGQPIGYMIPSKVPLDESYNDLVAPGKRYSSKQVINSLRRNQRELGLVIDLTNTTRYYSPSEWTKLGIKHIKIRCKGRDAVPDNESVNSFVYEVLLSYATSLLVVCIMVKY